MGHGMGKDARRACALLARLRLRRKRALLLPAQTLVMARHLLPLAVFAKELGVDVFFTISPKLEDSSERRLIAELFAGTASFVDPVRAHFHRWSLIVVADHGYFHSLAWSGSPLVHVGHGNPSKTSRRFPQIPWEYSHAARWPNGRVIYTEMIESAEGVKSAILDISPEKGSKIRVLGRPLDDDLLEKRAQAMARHMPHATKPSFLIISTLGEQSAFHLYWNELVALAQSLSDQYAVTLCPHPNEYAYWRARLGNTGLKMIDQALPVEALLAEASLVMTDFSSVCQKAALLNIPIIFCREDNMPVWSEGATARLYDACPKWQPGDPIDRVIQTAALDESAQRDLVLRWINSYPGQAKERFTAWLRDYFVS